ncbi:Nudix family hydrolase [Amphritea sp. HPY]|uniref:Nudix family hydrolase n=1 Tax=Amphritea sp. HPY TaxID=3421652 RepID=UPI003D7D6DFA
MSRLIHVAAAAIFNTRGQLLLALRDEKQHQGGLWEFPGGKVEASEDVCQALARELYEELGIEIDLAATRPLIKVPYHYPDKSVLLDVFCVKGYSGQAYGREGQEVRWVKPDQLTEYQFPAANQPIVNSLLLPQTIAITPQVVLSEYSAIAETAIGNGADWLMLRAKNLSSTAQVQLAAQLKQQLSGRAGLVLNGTVEEGNLAGIDALHLSSARLQDLQQRQQFNGRWLGASCHNEVQLERAVSLGLDYVTLSPVKHTSSHPETPALGWQEFARLANAYPIPVYALGGVGPDDLADCQASGGQGIAAISAFQKAEQTTG